MIGGEEPNIEIQSVSKRKLVSNLQAYEKRVEFRWYYQVKHIRKTTLGYSVKW